MEHCEKSHNDDKSGLILVCHKQGVFSESPITLAEAIKRFPRDFKSWRAKALVEACHQSAPLEVGVHLAAQNIQVTFLSGRFPSSSRQKLKETVWKRNINRSLWRRVSNQVRDQTLEAVCW